MAIPAWAISLGMTAISKKFAAETIDERLVREANEIPRMTEFDKKGIKKAIPLWATVIGVILTALSAKGYIDPVLYEALTSLLSNPEVIEAIDSAVE